ncbi:uracil-DNA glycosylase [Rhizobiaceae bacterium BDR2-2]|uniref:Uracil-DNA glycosylase n=1 Tax=Ectorhizobium quercum TaxID=2965071 RepID=A0AAE3SW66_9HYPH|nr:uracil-DNA glycosylase [Ectorhizobium quercum]MCX8998438.1 uracil-DNA glycosylase [Ectorhizobium quercum]
MIEAAKLDAPELAALLHFYADAGVEWLVEDEAVDSFAAFAAARAAQQQAAPAGQTPSRTEKPAASPATPAGTPVVPNEEAVAQAREAAAQARSLDELKERLVAFNGCNLRLSALSTIFASGGTESGVMIVGPLPEQDDEREGTAFSGPSGFLLERMIGAIGLKRESVLTTTLVPWRTPGNRAPLPHEIEICRPFIERQVELAGPRALLLLGNLTVRTFFGATGNIHQLRGQWRDLTFGSHVVPALASLHPSELIKAPRAKPQAWADLLSFARRIGTL